MTSGWKLEETPSQAGKIGVVTGANVGLGFETAKALAARGMEVVLACRNREKAKATKDKIIESHAQASLHIMELDLSSLKSVRSFAEKFKQQFEKLDLLVNNAGVMLTPYQITEDGFEQQMGINYLGHFLLAGLLLPKLEAAENTRIVTLSSLSHNWGDIYFDDMAFEEGYSSRKAYGQSKLACLMFAYEMQRRLKARGHSTISLAAHPGISDTELVRNLPKFIHLMAKVLAPIFIQSAAEGALPNFTDSFR
ncbi:NAD(P)-dependent dehydrogenase (short-subunit alcohol dehydrogenase family) [Catalinimonas alkaloidigena]|uniref:oxidoreductase n=1 Tax=Catalinimonas alkaloidigena TaxID=1075417 RepID=UPI002406D933|nr:oxidoreductase [Catalinimonas alkaloidigena]MDF9798538.1 NAD(P)-dependent dehydrogenase (short-subunit alcohol dehydrogenase family) [Catalinimonas alkaloidigena]